MSQETSGFRQTFETSVNMQWDLRSLCGQLTHVEKLSTNKTVITGDNDLVGVAYALFWQSLSAVFLLVCMLACSSSLLPPYLMSDSGNRRYVNSTLKTACK